MKHDDEWWDAVGKAQWRTLQEEESETKGNKVRYKETWNDTEEGILFEIQRFNIYSLDDKDRWTFYLYVMKHNQAVPEEFFSALVANTVPSKYGFDYMDSMLANLEWHCGITFGEIIYDESKEIRGYKVGCDYSHYWDEGIHYNLEMVEQDARKCARSLVTMIKTEATHENPQNP